MGNEQSFCAESVPTLQIPTTLDQGLQINLKNFKEHAPNKSYARKTTFVDLRLAPQVQESLKSIITISPLKSQQYQGYKLPTFYIIKNDVYYAGEWLNCRPHGKGQVYFHNGSFFQGWFNQGQAVGQENIFIYPDGSYYRGGFINSKKNGYGCLVYHTGLKFEGTWKDGVPHGKNCKQTYKDKSYYEGEFINGIKEGKGIYVWANGKVYIGDFKNGLMTGHGILKKGQHSLVEAIFNSNKIQNAKFMKLAYGKYEGEFQNGRMSGKGMFTWNDGRIYVGDFKKGKMHGKGTINFQNGTRIIGEWQNDHNIKVSSIQ